MACPSWRATVLSGWSLTSNIARHSAESARSSRLAICRVHIGRSFLVAAGHAAAVAVGQVLEAVVVVALGALLLGFCVPRVDVDVVHGDYVPFPAPIVKRVCRPLLLGRRCTILARMAAKRVTNGGPLSKLEESIRAVGC